MMDKRNKLKLALALNIVLTLLEINILCYRILTAGMEVVVLRFQYFSYYSNFLILISSIAMIGSLVYQIRGKRERISYGVRLMRYMSVSAEVLTTFVVVLFLLPLSGFSYASRVLFDGAHFLEYIVCAVLAFVSFVMLGDLDDFGRRETVTACIPLLLYSVVMIILNAAGVVDGPYVFLRVRSQSVGMTIFWFIICNAISYIVAFSLLTIAHMESRQNGKKTA